MNDLLKKEMKGCKRILINLQDILIVKPLKVVSAINQFFESPIAQKT